MPEILRSLMVILIIASFVFFFANKYAQPLGFSPQILKIRIKAWYLITAAAFLTHNFWVFCVITSLVLVDARKKDPNPLALVFFILFSVPLFGVNIPGMGVVNYIFELNYFRLLSLFVFLPTFLEIRSEKNVIAFGRYWPDRFLIGYIVYTLILLAPHSSVTNIMRVMFNYFLDVFLPYYVVSRYLRDVQKFDDAVRSLIFASVLIGLIGIVEYSKGWLLYSKLEDTLDANWGYGRYLLRGDSLRALASTGQPIVLGYIMCIAMGLYLHIGKKINSKKVYWSLLIFIFMGLFAPLSRGPWIGAAVIAFVALLFQPKPIKNLIKIGLIISLPLSILLVTPFGNKLIDYLPFVGQVDAQNVTFRQDLLSNSLMLIAENPFFGSNTFMQSDEMESLRSGGDGGIIDLVNSYIAIALSGGLVGLFLFLGYFVASTCYAYIGWKRSKSNAELHQLGAALVATMVGIMVVIYTVSSITFIPILYWIIGAMCVSYCELVANLKKAKNTLQKWS